MRSSSGEPRFCKAFRYVANCEVSAQHLYNDQRREKFPGDSVAPVMTDALKDLGQDHVADGEWSDLE